MVGTQNAHNLLSASSDGVICSWQLDMLAKPHETLDLNANFVPSQASSTISSMANYAEVSVTSMGFADQDTTRFCVGTEEGAIYEAARYTRAGAKAGISGSDVYRGHAGPVTGLHFHPLAGPIDFSDLFLTSSVDWTSRLWRARSANAPRSTQTQNIPPILTFEESSDYVYDVKWHPKHPALFAQVDGAGKFDIYNLNQNTEVSSLSSKSVSQTHVRPCDADLNDLTPLSFFCFSLATLSLSTATDPQHSSRLWSSSKQASLGQEGW